MKVSAIILNYNGEKDTVDCLTSLQKITRTNADFETIVVDNASADTSVAAIKKKFPHIKLLVNRENLGFAQGNNVGMNEALKSGADFIWILNNDTVVDQSCLTHLLSATQKKATAIWGAKIYFFPGREYHRQKYQKQELGKVIWYAGGIIDWKNMLASHKGIDEVDKGQFWQLSKTDFVTGCSMFISRKVVEKIGLFDTKFYLYYEDVDFCQRARKKGFDSYFVPRAVIWHKNAETAGGPGSDLQTYYITRNRLLVGMRYAPWKTKLALFREAIDLVMRGQSTQKHAVGDFLRKKYGRRITGSRIKFFAPKIDLLGRFTRKKA